MTKQKQGKVGKHIKVAPGKRVRINSQGNEFTGTVITCQNVRDPVFDDELNLIGWSDDWHIELNDDTYGYIYWKQRYDRGTVELIK